MNKNSIIYILLFLGCLFFFFQVMGIAILILKTLAYLVFRFWYVFLILFLVYYLFRKKRPKQGAVHEERGKKVIEVKDYKIK